MSTNFDISMSSYHGSEMEGPAVRRLMEMWEEVFLCICEYLLLAGISIYLPASEGKIKTMCDNVGNLCILLDGTFSLLNTKRGSATNLVLDEL